MRVSQAFVREDSNQEVFTEIAARLPRRAAATRSASSRSTSRSSTSSSDIATALVLGAGQRARRATARSRSATLIAFLLYLNLFFAPIQQLSQVFDSYQQARRRDRPHRRAARHAARHARRRRPGACPAGCAARSCFDDVHFKYSHRDRRGAARRRPARSRPARPSRSSARPARASRTVMKLVARFYDPTVGHGARRRRRRSHDYDPVAFHQQLGVVPQEAFLFSGTIRDNIAYGRQTRPTPRSRRRRGRSAPTTSSRRSRAATSSG